MWLNKSIAIINVTFQLLDIYRYRFVQFDFILYIYIYIYVYTHTLATLFFIKDQKISCILIWGGLE